MKASGIGGQAVMEGVMMRNGSDYAVAVRKPDKTIEIKKDKYYSASTKSAFFRLPIIRGVVAFVDSLVLGMSTLTYSSELLEEDDDSYEPSGFEKLLINIFKEKAADVVMTLVVLISIVMAVGIFVLLPTFIASLLGGIIKSEMKKTLVEGVIRLMLFLLYVWLISLMKDIKRTYMYHGAEHKCINCIEAGMELNVENVRASSRFHKRCGTSFLFIVMFISIIMFMFIRTDNFVLKIVFRLLLIPVISGISYEFIKLAGSKESKLLDVLSAPGMLLQRITTCEPDDDMIEVGMASVEAVFDWKSFVENINNEKNDEDGLEEDFNEEINEEFSENLEENEEGFEEDFKENLEDFSEENNEEFSENLEENEKGFEGDFEENLEDFSEENYEEFSENLEENDEDDINEVYDDDNVSNKKKKKHWWNRKSKESFDMEVKILSDEEATQEDFDEDINENIESYDEIEFEEEFLEEDYDEEVVEEYEQEGYDEELVEEYEEENLENIEPSFDDFDMSDIDERHRIEQYANEKHSIYTNLEEEESKLSFFDEIIEEDDDVDKKGFFARMRSNKKRANMSASERISTHQTISVYDEDYDESDELLRELDRIFENKADGENENN